MGDYMTFVGTDKTASNLVEENGPDTDKGQYFFTNNQYEFQGVPIDSNDTIMWERSSISEHIGGDLTDALASCNESLKMNNSQVVQFLDHLTANSIFVNKLVANQAFIKQLTTNKLIVEAITDPKSEAGSEALGVKNLQKIYYLSNKTSTPTAPTSYVTASSNTAGIWTTAITPFTSDYKYLFSCTQYKKDEKDGDTVKEVVICTTISRDTEAEQGLKAIFNASSATTTANSAITKAESAITQANSATATATTATKIKRVLKIENLYYLRQKDANHKDTTAPTINSDTAISDSQLNKEGWSTKFPDTSKYDTEVGYVTCDTASVAVVFTCQRLTVTENGTQSYEFTEVSVDHTMERLYAITGGKTLIEGGYIKTDLLDVDKIFAKRIKLQNTKVGDETVYGSIYGGNRYNADGTDLNTSAKGFYLGADGTLKAKDGYFEGEINATSGTFSGLINADVFHFNKSFAGTDTGYTDSSGTFHSFVNGDMWLVES